MTKQQKDVQRIIKHLEKAADIAGSMELLDERGGFLDSQLTTLATMLFYQYVQNAPEHLLEAVRKNA